MRVESDSELMVKQMRGQYKVKSEELKPLFERAKKISQTFESFQIIHVYREQNKEADALANQALDETSGSGGAPGAKAGKPAGRDGSMRLIARYKDGVFEPYDALDLPEGTEVELLLRLRK